MPCAAGQVQQGMCSRACQAGQMQQGMRSRACAAGLVHEAYLLQLHSHVLNVELHPLLGGQLCPVDWRLQRQIPFKSIALPVYTVHTLWMTLMMHA